MILKKHRLTAIFTLVLIMSAFTQIRAQTIELTPFIGYETGGRLYTYEGHLLVGDGMNYGGALDFTFAYGTQVEISYNHMMTTLSLDEGFLTRKLSDMAVDYYSIGVLKELNPEETIIPYAMGSMGWVNYRPTSKYSNENLMHFSIAGGVKVFATSHFGIRLQARLLIPIWYSGVYFSGGTGGAGLGLSAQAAAVQGDFTAALIIRFGE